MKPAVNDISPLIRGDVMRRAIFPLLMLLALMLPSMGRAAAPAPASVSPQNFRDLLALGTDQLYWSADVVPVINRHETAAQTIVRVRSAGEALWKEVGAVAAPVSGLAHRGSELLLVLDDGQWMIASDSGVRSGLPAPGGAEVLALAGDGDDIWAVAAAPAGRMITPTTAPATRSNAATEPASTTAAAPSTAPAFPPHDVGLFLLRRGNWEEQDLLPRAVRRNDIRAISLAMLDRRLMLAVASRDLSVRVYTRDANGWDDGVELAFVAERGEIRLMSIDARPALWVVDGATTPGSLFIRNDRWDGPIKLHRSPKLDAFDTFALTVALGRLRLIASDGKGRLAEQLYNADGTLAGQATEAQTIPREQDQRLNNALQVLVMVILLAWMLGSMRQRPAVNEALRHIEQLQLAPLGRRFVGGLIDFVPLVVALVIADQILRRSGQPVAARLTITSPEFAWLAAGVGLYLLLTTVLELTLGRSLGKLVAGTRVASLDGSRPAAAAVLLRNLLRLIDILLLLFPLSFIFFSPLRQRVGDMAAGTIVVMKDAPMPPPAPAEPPRESES
jgi:uncharacterized RDD family membrane protein YckC